jgi:hypothetical protein
MAGCSNTSPSVTTPPKVWYPSLPGCSPGSVSLVGFRRTVLIEVTSGAALLWRLCRDFDASRRERVKRTTLRIVGACFAGLALSITYESASKLIRHEIPEQSIPGIVMAAISVVVMPLLADPNAESLPESGVQL